MKSESQHFLTAAEAAAALGVSRATLYAYTSRGQLRSEPVPGQPRERRYLQGDVDRLKERKEVRKDPAKAAARGLHWGSPVLDSAITLIDNGRVYYRGHDAIELAETATLEEVAALLWGAERLPELPLPLSRAQLAQLRRCSPDPFTRMQIALPVAATADLESYDLRPASVQATGARILRLLTAMITGRESTGPSHLALASAWGSPDAIRAALVLCADHELNASAFTARCAASAGASPYLAVSAALATLKGSKHGGLTERVSALFAAVKTPAAARSTIAAKLRRGDTIPGFGHPLYPGGDPRAAMLLEIVGASGNRAEFRLAHRIAKAGSEMLHDPPSIDFALVALARAYHMPDCAPLLLFALGRVVGWIAHAMEQYAAGELIRPRARYVGPPPAVSPQ